MWLLANGSVGQDFLGDTESQIVTLQTRLGQKEREISSLRGTVSSLSDQLNLLEQSSGIRLGVCS